MPGGLPAGCVFFVCGDLNADSDDRDGRVEAATSLLSRCNAIGLSPFGPGGAMSISNLEKNDGDPKLDTLLKWECLTSFCC